MTTGQATGAAAAGGGAILRSVVREPLVHFLLLGALEVFDLAKAGVELALAGDQRDAEAAAVGVF